MTDTRINLLNRFHERMACGRPFTLQSLQAIPNVPLNPDPYREASRAIRDWQRAGWIRQNFRERSQPYELTPEGKKAVLAASTQPF